MHQINLLQPEFVLSVGDLIEGYTEEGERLCKEWKEFEGFVNKLEMPPLKVTVQQGENELDFALISKR